MQEAISLIRFTADVVDVASHSMHGLIHSLVPTHNVCIWYLSRVKIKGEMYKSSKKDIIMNKHRHCELIIC